MPKNYFLLIANFMLNIILPIDCFHLNDERLEINEYRSIASCIAQIGKSELFWKPTVVLKIGNNHTKNEKDFLDEMLTQLEKNTMPYIAIDTVESGALDSLKASYLIVNYFEDCEAAATFDFDSLINGMKYLNIVDKYTDVCNIYLKYIRKAIGQYDISIFVKDSGSKYDLYTYIPDIDPKTCQVVIEMPIKINTCSDGALVSSTVFPRKVTTNLMKCPFKVGMGTLFPFAMIVNRTSLKTYDPLEMDRITGMDVEIIKILSHCFNATLQMYYIHKQEENPYVNKEYLSFLLNGSLEACAGGLYRIYGNVVEYSGIYQRQTIMWIYTAERERRTWDNMVMSIDGLYLFIIFYLSYSIVWCLICIFDKHAVSLTNTLIYAWGALVGTTSLQDAKSLKQKILNIVYLNMCLHLSVYISIQLYSFLTIRGPPEIFKTNEDIMNSGRTPFLKTLTKYFIKDERYERFANTSAECAGFQDCAELSLKLKGVTVFIQGYFFPFQAATAVNDEARMLRAADNLLTVYYEMIMRKESPLVFKFKRIIGWLFEAGITRKLFKEAIGITIVGKAKIATQNMMMCSYACQAGCKLSLKQFSGVFFVWGLGCLVSFCLFTIEVWLKRNVTSV